MPVLYHVLYAVLALSGLKLTEGECFKPHILLVAEAILIDPHHDLCPMSQVFISSGSVSMPDADAATVPLIYPGETPGQAELEAYLEVARPKFLRGPVSYLVQGKDPPEWGQYAPQPAVPESDAERPGPPTPPATQGGQPGPPGANIVDFAALRKIQYENRGIAMVSRMGPV